MLDIIYPFISIMEVQLSDLASPEMGIFLYLINTREQDVTFCILYFYSNSCSTCFGQPCAHHQELTTA